MSLFDEPLEYYTDHPRIILDSGAFSKWNSGSHVDLGTYEAYVPVVNDCLLTAVNLDVIPDPSAPHHACHTSYTQWRRLRQSCGEVMPVYHQHESYRWLYKYIEDGATYIGISPHGDLPTVERQRWLYNTHLLLDTLGVLNREVYTHGLGVFAPAFLPTTDGLLWSADATSLMHACVSYRLFLPLDAQGEVTDCAPTSFPKVYVGESDKVVERKDTNWDAVKRYLDSIDLDDHYYEHSGRIAMDIPAIAAANIHATRLLMSTSGVRCFIAGNDPQFLRQIVVEEKYPYILRSFASIKERDLGTTIRNIYNRELPAPL